MMFKVWLSKLKTLRPNKKNSLQTLPGSPLWRGPRNRLPHFFWGRFTSIVFLRLKNWGIQPCRPPASAAKPLKTCSNEDWPEIKEQNAIYQRWKEWDVNNPIWSTYASDKTSIIHTKFIYSYYFTNPNFRESIKILYSRTSVEVTLMGHLIAVQRHTEKSLKQKRAFSSGDLKLKPGYHWIPENSLKICLRRHRFGMIIVVDGVHDQRKKMRLPKKTSYCSSTKILHQLILPLNSFEM